MSQTRFTSALVGPICWSASAPSGSRMPMSSEHALEKLITRSCGRCPMSCMRFAKPHGSRSSNELRRLLPKKTHTPRRFISSLTVPLRFGNCLLKHPVGMTDLQIFKQLKIEIPPWTKGHISNSSFSSQLVLRSQMLSSLLPNRRRWRSNAGDRSFASTVAGPCAGKSRCCSDSLRRTVGS